MNTAKLPEVELKLPESVLGKNTIHAIQAGVLHGYTGLIKGMLEAIRLETGLKFTVIATGGLSSILTNLEGVFDAVDRNLTLDGLRLITKANS
jgi:type III pantothenate kinase